MSTPNLTGEFLKAATAIQSYSSTLMENAVETIDWLAADRVPMRIEVERMVETCHRLMMLSGEAHRALMRLNSRYEFEAVERRVDRGPSSWETEEETA